MKRYLLIAFLFLLGSCQTPYPELTTNPFERQSLCEQQNPNGYWGTCYIKQVRSDPNYSNVAKAEAANVPKAFNFYSELEVRAYMLEESVAKGEISAMEANLKFLKLREEYISIRNKEVEAIVQRQELEQQERSLKLQELAAALQSANDKLYPSGSNNTFNQNTASLQTTKWYSFDREEINGKFKTCYFVNGFVNVVTTTVLATQNCPVGVRQ